MKIILLGTSGYHPCDARETACFALPELNILLDAGTGIYRLPELSRGTLSRGDGQESERWDIFITHAHLDHIVGLTYLFDLLPREALGNVTIHGEAEKLAAIRNLLFAEALFPVTAPFRFEPLEGLVQHASGATISYFPLDHPGGSVGYRVDTSAGSLAYVSDTIASPDADYIDAIRGVDLLLHEAYFVTEDKEMIHRTGHSHVMAAAEVAKEAEVGRLLLIHLNPLIKDDSEIDIEQARRLFPATEIGTDRMEVEF